MDIISKLLRSFLLVQAALVLMTPQMAAAQNSNLYGEYIGALFNGVKFTDVPINSNVDFHFILAFAIDYTSTPSPTDGQFNIFWDSTNLSPSAVSSIKQSNGNVKVALSLGGATVSGQNVVFTASSVDTWVSNAVSSLTPIIQQYGLDGIDIDYENFDDSSATVDTFVECIGRLITTLKDNGVISFASIAPFDDATVQSHYQALWQKYSGVIDYVNFQFYAYSASTTVSEFLDHYNQQLSNYNGGKILTSFISDGSGGLTPANGFFDACSTLQSQNKLPGIFAWSADTSLNTGNGFQYETQAQQLLANA